VNLVDPLGLCTTWEWIDNMSDNKGRERKDSLCSKIKNSVERAYSKRNK
jgi:hypothetical protein